VGYDVQQYFSYIVEVSFIGGGNQRKPPIWGKSLTNLYWVHLVWVGFELRTVEVICT